MNAVALFLHLFVVGFHAKMANEAMHRIDGSILDSHSLQVKPSDKRISSSVKTSAATSGDSTGNNKLIVRNVAFQATKAEIGALFSSFGSLKRVRIPKKIGGEHRGFAFVEFSSSKEAAAAMASLQNSHLYGKN
jgi:multiple RNA-binding domain-containing protein 1